MTILYFKECPTTVGGTMSTLQHMKSVLPYLQLFWWNTSPHEKNLSLPNPKSPHRDHTTPHHVRSTIPFPRLTTGPWCLLPGKYLNYDLEYLRRACSVNLPRLSNHPVAEHLWHQICRSDRALFPRVRKENALATTKGEISKVLSS